jgi:outer membrane protein OmpA-like peptidoglycan-associated protein
MNVVVAAVVVAVCSNAPLARSAVAEGPREAAMAATQSASDAAHAAEAVESLRYAAAAELAARHDLRRRLNADPVTRDTDGGLVVDMGRVQFAAGSAIIDAANREALARLPEILASYPGLRLRVEGHTDSSGSTITNRALSLRRATIVRNWLIGNGVAASSIEVVGFGSSMPSADNATVDGRARNRRVEIVLFGGPLSSSY